MFAAVTAVGIDTLLIVAVSMGIGMLPGRVGDGRPDR